MAAVKIKKDMMPDLRKRMRALGRTQVLVGIPDDAPNVARREPGAPSNAEVGFVMEFGSPATGVPARPFLIPGATAYLEQAKQELLHATLSAVQGLDAQLQRDLDTIGDECVLSVQGELQGGDHQALAPATLARRRARGNGDDTPLLDTHQLNDALTFEVVKP